MNVSLEYLYHFLCDDCRKWWTFADIAVEIGDKLHCPHCGFIGKVESIKTYEIAN